MPHLSPGLRQWPNCLWAQSLSSPLAPSHQSITQTQDFTSSCYYSGPLLAIWGPLDKDSLTDLCGQLAPPKDMYHFLSPGHICPRRVSVQSELTTSALQGKVQGLIPNSLLVHTKCLSTPQLPHNFIVFFFFFEIYSMQFLGIVTQFRKY